MVEDDKRNRKQILVSQYQTSTPMSSLCVDFFTPLFVYTFFLFLILNRDDKGPLTFVVERESEAEG